MKKRLTLQKKTKVVVVHKFLLHMGPEISGRWPQLTGGRCSEVTLVLKQLGRDLRWLLLTGGHYSEVVNNTGLTVLKNIVKLNIFSVSLFLQFLQACKASLDRKYVTLSQLFSSQPYKISFFPKNYSYNMNSRNGSQINCVTQLRSYAVTRMLLYV